MKLITSVACFLSLACVAAVAQLSPLGLYSGEASNGDKVFISIMRRDFGSIYKLSYGGQTMDLATITLTAANTFSFVSLGGSSGNGTVSGVTATGVFGGVSFTARRESFDGPTRAIAADYFGTSFDPFISEMSTVVVNVLARGTILFLSIRPSSYDGGIGTISPTGQFSIPTLAGDTYTGILKDQNGIASGQAAIAGYGSINYTLIRTPTARFQNISTRGRVGAGEEAMIAGFIVSDYAKLVYIRVLGPSLEAFGITGAVANPKVDLYIGQTILASNDDWASNTNAAEISSTGSAPLHAKDSALLVRLEPGAYTAVVTGMAGGTGVALVEVNEVR